MDEERNSELIRGSEVIPKEIDWLWYPYIPIGKITTIQGDPGEGKSTFALNLAALVTRGEAFPFSDDAIEPMNVIYQNTEDDLDDTVIPRFIKAGGDTERIYFIDESNNPLTFSDVDRIENAIRECDAKLIIFDPLVSYIGESVSMNNANEVRAQFNKLIQIAKQNKCAILIVGHMNKMQGVKAMYRAVGSIDVVAAARSCLLIGTYDDPDNRVMAVQKCNLAEKGAAIRFEIIDGNVNWIDVMDITADELLNSCSSLSGNKSTSKMETAKDCLVDWLSEGAKPQQEVIEKFNEMGISRRTAENAKKELGIRSVKQKDHWTWQLS